MIRRIRRRSIFDELRRDGRRSRHGPITLTYLSAAYHPPRVGFAIGRAVGPAVVRNRLRRRLRTLMDEACREHRLPDGAWLVSASPAAARLDHDELDDVLNGALGRATR